MSVPTQVVKLVDQFKDQLQAAKSPQYKEAWVRVNYIDPLFKALGWDVHQENSGTLIHKEVVHEDSLRVEGAMKAPDYCFYNGGSGGSSSRRRNLPSTSSMAGPLPSR